MTVKIIPAPSSSSTTSDLALSKHVISTNFTIPAAQSAVVARYVSIAAGITLTVGADGDLKIT